ncbi:hypothetical protein OSSY52_02100 [Tepiditoga spiralis]|uniref:Uncharacterized protein n=1 Tax=Tepiditoga spiralis TaxID=2108365 RepID=A0A7G1G9R3_9BACT|nr:hypothetical protein OSSY52_02100 [Tepiditoga spiralis]
MGLINGNNTAITVGISKKNCIFIYFFEYLKIFANDLFFKINPPITLIYFLAQLYYNSFHLTLLFYACYNSLYKMVSNDNFS